MKTCTYCGHENEDNVVNCSGCGKALETSATKGVGALKDTALDPVIVGTFENTEHAGVLRAELEAAGIEAWIPEDFSIEFPPQTVSVQVAAKDAGAAHDIAEEFRKARGLHQPTTSSTAPGLETEASMPPGSIPNRRACVSCGAPIAYEAVLCPKCGWTQPQLS